MQQSIVSYPKTISGHIRHKHKLHIFRTDLISCIHFMDKKDGIRITQMGECSVMCELS